MKDPLQPNRCARMLAALAAPERLRIVDYLREGPRTVGEIAQMLREPVVNVSHHLMVLRHARLVRSERKGRYRIYSLCPSVFRPDEDAKGTGHLNLGCCRIEMPKTETDG
jgi:DNA-binding transcriptional ArsR family regulator